MLNISINLLPNSPPKPCPRHPKILLGRGATCPECPKSNWTSDKVRGNRHQRGYGTAWDKLRPKILRRDQGLCVICRSKGYMVAAKEVDHKIPKTKGGTDDPNNLQSLCTQCHREKTARE